MTTSRLTVRILSNGNEFISRHGQLALLVGLGFVIGILYLPALTARFISDDFSQISLLYFNINDLLNGRLWKEWFIGVLDGYVFFRPAAYAIMLVDFLMWNLFAPGYHLTRVILHLLASFLVYLIGWELSRSRVAALIAVCLFAVLPIHAGAVSWIAATTDVLGGLAFLTGFLFFVFYRRKGGMRNLIVSLAAFVVALSAKEIAIVFPAAIFLYDGFFYFPSKHQLRRALIRHAPFWTILILYFGMRIFIIGSFGYRGMNLAWSDVWNWIVGTWLNAVDPFLANAGQASMLLLLVVPVVVLWATGFRRAILFGLAWIPLTFVPTINSITGPTDRSFYVPSLGVVLVIGSVFARLLSSSNRLVRPAAMGSFLVLLIVYGWTLMSRNDAFHRAGEIAAAIPQQVKAMHPTFPRDARLTFVGVPDRVPEGILVYLSGFPSAMALAYSSEGFETLKFNNFPIWFDKLDRTFFFQVDHRKVTERSDLVQILKERKACSSTPVPMLTWQFEQDAQGWEPWNDLTGFEIREGALTTAAQGNDPYMASPTVNIPSIAISRVEIEMRAKSDPPANRGALYWLASGQTDFSPGFMESFSVQADGSFHTYSVNLIESGKLLMDTSIVQFRLDPVETPAQIAIKSVRILSPCSSMSEDHCICRN